MALNDVIARFQTPGVYTVTRTVPSTYDVHGVLVPGAETAFDVTASVQPEGGREVDDDGTGEYGSEVKVVYCTTELLTRTPASESDYFTFDGEDWYVWKVERWQHWGANHWRAWISKLTLP